MAPVAAPDVGLATLNWLSRPTDSAKSPERGTLDRAGGRGKAFWHNVVALFRRDVACFVESFQTKSLLAANKKPDREVGLSQWTEKRRVRIR
jgi:hypothetical protein